MTAAEPEDRANRLGRIVDRLGSQRAGGERVLRFEGESSEGTALVESRDRQLRLWIPPARRSALETMLERFPVFKIQQPETRKAPAEVVNIAVLADVPHTAQFLDGLLCDLHGLGSEYTLQISSERSAD